MNRRLVLAITAVAAGAVLLFALPLAVVLERNYRGEELLRLQRDTVAATRGIDLSRRPDRLELPRFAGQVGVYSRNGARLAGVGPLAADPATLAAMRRREPTSAPSAGELTVAVPLLVGEQVSGALRSQRSDVSVSERTRHTWLELAGLGLGVVALAALAAVALSRRLARPLEMLAATARRVGEGDFAARALPTRIEEIDAVGAAMNKSSQRVGELVGRERAFSSDASHQLRTPLAALRLELESAMLIAAEPRPELAAALVQVERLEATIQTLLAVLRDIPSSEHKADLNQAAQDAEARWRGPLAAVGRPLRTDLSGGVAQAAISSAVLTEIIEVLLDNAATHGTGTVTIGVRSGGDTLGLEVTDQGPGFGPDIEAAFKRGIGSGHGIGLSLARALAHAEGARLQVAGSGAGATVSLSVRRA